MARHSLKKNGPNLPVRIFVIAFALAVGALVVCKGNDWFGWWG
jgi:hypothetical protein